MSEVTMVRKVIRLAIPFMMIVALACSFVPLSAYARPISAQSVESTAEHASNACAQDQSTYGVMASAKHTMSVRYSANGATMATTPLYYVNTWYRLNNQGMVQSSSDGVSGWRVVTTTLTTGVSEAILKMVGRCDLHKPGYHSNAGIDNTHYYNLSADLSGSYIDPEHATTKAVNGGTEITSDITSPITLYVVWLPNTYTVAYDANGGQWPAGSTTSTEHTYDKSSSLTASKPTRAHYSFGGWQINGAGSVYSSGQSVLNLVAQDGASVTMKAVWIENARHSVTYDAAGGSGFMPDEVVYTDEQATVANCSFTRPGYEFVGWNTASDGSGQSYEAGDAIDLQADTVLVAQWHPLQLSFSVPSDISCTLKANGDLTFDNANSTSIANLADAGISVVGVKTAAAPGFTLTRVPIGEGDIEYSFVPGDAQRFSASDAAGDEFASVDWPIAKGSNLRFSRFQGKIARLGSVEAARLSLGTITWKLSLHNVVVSYDGNGGGGAMGDQRVSAEVPFAAPECCFKHAGGKQFSYWCENPDGTGATYPAGSTVSFSEDATLFAIWK